MVVRPFGRSAPGQVMRNERRAPRAPVEPTVKRVVSLHLGVGPEELTPDVSLTDDLAADSLDLAELSCALEEELDITVPESILGEVRTYRDLVHAIQALGRRQHAAETPAEAEPAFVWVTLLPARSRGELQRGGRLTPYSAEAIVGDALRGGPGSRLDVSVAVDSSDAALEEVRERFAWLSERGVQVSIRRGARSAAHYPEAAA